MKCPTMKVEMTAGGKSTRPVTFGYQKNPEESVSSGFFFVGWDSIPTLYGASREVPGGRRTEMGLTQRRRGAEEGNR